MKRIQIGQTKDWKMPENTVYVGHPTEWGNPFCVDELGEYDAAWRYRECVVNNAMAYYFFDEIEATIQFERFKWIAEHIEELRGKDLACSCQLDISCHADVLIELLRIAK